MIFETILGVICCTLVGAVTLLCAIYQRTKLRSCEAWPRVIGTIRKDEVVQDTGPDSSGFFVSVRYDYSVNEAPHQGSKVGFRRRAYLLKNSAKEVVDRYQPNITVPVFYDPETPCEAVLVREYPTTRGRCCGTRRIVARRSARLESFSV